MNGQPPPVEMCLVFVLRDGECGREVLLGVKRRGFGTGRVVGPGGKIEPGETPPQAATRELFEETGLHAQRLDARGVVTFVFSHASTSPDLRAHVFVTDDVTGVAADSDEIVVQWTPLGDIDHARMWADARHWLPLALDGRLREATFWYAPDGVTLERFEL